MDLSATSSTWLLAMGRWLLWMLGEQREKRRGVMGPGTQWVFLSPLHSLPSCAAQGCSGQSPVLSSWS